MLVLTMGSALTILLFIYLFMPSLWLSIMAVDEYPGNHDYGLTVVAARHPFRETKEPVNMAKLVLLRQKIQSTNRKRRSSSPARHAPRSMTLIPMSRPNRSKASWIRFGRPFGSKHNL